MKRQSAKASMRPSRHRIKDNICSFETLEARQLLAFAAFDSTTGTLDIIYESGESLVTVGNNNEYLTIDGAEATVWNSTSRRIRIAQIENIVVHGNADASENPVSLKFANKFNEINAPLLQNLTIYAVNDAFFAGQIVLENDLTIAVAIEQVTISQSIESALTVNGDTNMRLQKAGVGLNHGLNDFVGPISIRTSSSPSKVWFADTNSLELDKINIAGFARFTAESISSTPESVIEVSGNMYVSADSITLGNNPQDRFAPDKLNFKSSGFVNVSADTDLLLIGANFAESALLQSTGWIDDAGSARTDIDGLLELRAALYVTLGEQDADEFNTGELSVVASGPVSINEDSSTMLYGVDVYDNLSVFSVGNIEDVDNTSIQVHGDAIFSGSNIQLGDSQGDQLQLTPLPVGNFVSARLNINSPGIVSVYSGHEITVFGENTAGDLTLSAKSGQISDVEGTQTVVQNHTKLSGSAITWGRFSMFTTNTLTLQSHGNVTVQEFNDMMLTGTNVANSFRLYSSGVISNTTNASLVATYRLDLAAASTDLGNQVGDNFQFSSARFSTTGAMNLQADSQIRMVLDNHASSLNLQSTGNIVDQPGSSVLIDQMAFLTGVDIILGNSPDECFNVLSQVVVASASGISNITLGC